MQLAELLVLALHRLQHAPAADVHQAQQQQLAERKQQDPSLQAEIEQLRKKVADYAARFTPQSTTEKDKSLIRIGVKKKGEEQVVRL